MNRVYFEQKNIYIENRFDWKSLHAQTFVQTLIKSGLKDETINWKRFHDCIQIRKNKIK